MYFGVAAIVVARYCYQDGSKLASTSNDTVNNSP